MCPEATKSRWQSFMCIVKSTGRMIDGRKARSAARDSI